MARIKKQTFYFLNLARQLDAVSSEFQKRYPYSNTGLLWKSPIILEELLYTIKFLFYITEWDGARGPGNMFLKCWLTRNSLAMMQSEFAYQVRYSDAINIHRRNASGMENWDSYVSVTIKSEIIIYPTYTFLSWKNCIIFSVQAPMCESHVFLTFSTPPPISPNWSTWNNQLSKCYKKVSLPLILEYLPWRLKKIVKRNKSSNFSYSVDLLQW